MNKRNVCRTATVLSGLLAIIIFTQPHPLAGHLPTDKLMGAALGLVSTIFGTQWIEYQKRQDMHAAQPAWPDWLRHLLFSSLLLLSILNANAQTTWTNRPQSVDQVLSDIAYGAGKYVAVGGDGIGEFIRTSPDGITWTSQLTDKPTTGGLYAVVYAGGQFVAVGVSGRVLTSPDGLTWTSQVSGLDGTSLLIGIAYGGGQYMAVGFDGIAITSPNGVTWTTLTTGVSTDFSNITYGGGRFIAVGKGGLIRTTPNGIIWTERISGTSANLRGITVGSGGSLVAVGENSTIVTSADGITWTKRSGPGTLINLTAVAHNPTTGKYVAVAAANNQVLTSPDGLNWGAYQSKSGTESYLYGVRFQNDGFIALGAGGTIRSSTNDGISWHPLTIDNDIQFRGAAYGNGRYVLVGKYPISLSPAIASVAATSLDGINYVLGRPEHFAGAGESFNNVVFGNGQFVAVGGEGIIQTSPDGLTWTLRYSGLGATIRAIAYGSGQYVAVGAGFGPGSTGSILRSTDGVSWTKTSSGSAFYSDITYANGQFVAVGSNGVIGTSPDGVNWTDRTSGTTDNLSYVVYGNGTYVALGIHTGSFTTVVRSTDGNSWTVAPLFNSNGVTAGITFGNGQFVTVVQGSKIVTSSDCLAWTQRNSDTFSNLDGLTHGNGLFVAVGADATVVTSPDDGGVPPANQAPTLANAILNQVATINQNFSYGIPANTFTDPDGNNLTLSATGLPNGLSLNGTTLSGTPTAEGASTVTVTATDGGNLSVSTQFTLTVNPVESNPSALVITGVTLVSCQALLATQRQLVFTPQYAGLNGQPVTFHVVNEMLPTTNMGPYTLGMYNDNPTIILKATQNGTPGEATFSYNWLAACTGGTGNQPPIAPVIPDASGTVGQVFSQSIPPFVDPEGQPLTYSVIGLPPGLLVIGGGNIVGPPSTAGVYLITITATDPGGLSASATYTLTINPAGSNPSALAITGVTLVSCQAISATQRQLVFTPQYAGLNGQPVTFHVVNEMLPTTNAGPYTLGMYNDNPTIILKATQNGTPGEATFSYNWSLICATQNARLGVSPLVESALEVNVLGNPVDNGALVVEVKGVAGQLVQMNLTNLRGEVVGSHQVAQATGIEEHTFEIGHQSAGLLLLRVSTPTQSKTVKVLKR